MGECRVYTTLVTVGRQRKAPRDYMPGAWPYGAVEDVDADWAAHAADVVAAFVRELIPALGEESDEDVARHAGVSVSTVRNLLAGRTWPDFHTIFAMQEAYGVAPRGRGGRPKRGPSDP